MVSFPNFISNLKKHKKRPGHNKYEAIPSQTNLTLQEDRQTPSHHSLSGRQVYPCPTCGEMLSKRHLLDVHQLKSHPLSELSADDAGYNVLRMIFHSGWKGPHLPTFNHVFKIQNSPQTLERFESYRNSVQSRNKDDNDGRCAADGNERMRFYCTTSLCPLSGGPCRSPYCCTCGIVRHGFKGKRAKAGGIGTYGTSWGAHVALPEELEREFGFLEVRRAVVVCRVVAGKISRGGEGAEGFDSVSARRQGGGEEEELVVYSHRALLPCFVVMYSVG